MTFVKIDGIVANYHQAAERARRAGRSLTLLVTKHDKVVQVAPEKEPSAKSQEPSGRGKRRPSLNTQLSTLN